MGDFAFKRNTKKPPEEQIVTGIKEYAGQLIFSRYSVDCAMRILRVDQMLRSIILKM